MKNTTKIFKDRLINNHLKKFTKDDIPEFENKWNIIKRWRQSCVDGDLEKTKETSIQGAFMIQIFEYVLGYITQTGTEKDIYNQTQEYNNVLDASEADGAIGFFSKSNNDKDVRGVIELKDAKKDLDKKQNRSSHLTPVEQAFIYANKNGAKCSWVIVSNFVETRLYKSNSSLEYEVFDIRKMDNEAEFIRFYFFLCKEHLINHNKSIIDRLYEENEELGIYISNDFYKTYKKIRRNLYNCIKELNPDKDKMFLFTKAQKLMDRFIFVCFCEDYGLLPQNVYKDLVNYVKHSYSFTQNKLWNELKGLFISIDKGNSLMNINRYNGGLFKEDKDLDELIISDEVLESFLELSEYDFGSDLNVNILGQIFEQSISDVEQIKRELKNNESVSRGKQKDDGIFYTPYYVTRYIVEQTVGTYLKFKKEEIKKNIFKNGMFKVSIFRPSTRKKNIIQIPSWTEISNETENLSEEDIMYREAVKELHLKYWSEYENVLKNIKICDPACGSGAFLNQCFDYLRDEINFVLEMKYTYNGQISLYDIDKEILQNNLYGVDINPESVEITKLSLWLKTAKQNQSLASLDNNIKCGNSLVDDASVDINAFNWQNEFPNVFKTGGFDIIIGNPPYGATVDNNQKKYINSHYSTAEGNFDTYRIFFELGFNILKTNGYLGFITPNTYFDLKRSGEKLRRFLFNNTLLKIVEVYNVFPKAIVEPVISIYKKSYEPNAEIDIILIPRNVKLNSTFINEGNHIYKKQEDLRKNNDYSFTYKINTTTETIVNTVNSNSAKLKDYYFVYNGAKPYEVGKGNPIQTKSMIKEKVYNGYNKIDDTWVPYIRGKSIQRYIQMWDGEYIKYGENLAAPRSADIFFREKIFVRQTGDEIIATIDNMNVSNNTLHIIFSKNKNAIDNKYLLGLLNSRFMSWYYRKKHPLEIDKPMAEVKKAFIEDLPVIIGTSEQITQLTNYVDELNNKCQFKYDKKKQFLHYVKSLYEPKSITEKLKNFEFLTFKEFIIELKRQKVKLSVSSQMELLEMYDNIINQINCIDDTIKKTQYELDTLVFEIYNIPNEYIKMIDFQISL